MTQTAFYLAAFVLTYFGVEIFRRWSLRREIFDVPNERSSHRSPTPRGGGLAIVAVCLFFYAGYTIFLKGNFAPGYFAGAVLIALVSWYDDLKSVAPVWRFLVHAFAAGLAIFSSGSWQTLSLPFAGEIYLGLSGYILAGLWIVWLTNAYNFMDGIDGIAATQAIVAGLGWFFLGWLLEAESIGFYGGLIVSTSFGFLLHNWPPARIFMGDVGSAFLGYSFAVMPFLLVFEKPESETGVVFAAAVLFVWLFVFDTVLTMFRRLLRGEKIWRAHRSHLYQKLVVKGYSHRFVTILYGLSSGFIMLAVLFWIYQKSSFGWIPALLAATFGCGLIIFDRFGKIVDVN